MTETVIFDLDGTLSNPEHRRHHVAGKNKDWDAFFEECSGDTPNVKTIELMNTLIADPDYEVLIWSGRSESVREKTTEWLRIHTDYLDYIQMRPIGDHRSDVELKQDWLHDFVEVNSNGPFAVFDDRQCVVDMWRANGIQCYQVNEGDFDMKKSIITPYKDFASGRLPLLVLLVGPSGAGKTTLARQIFGDHGAQNIVSMDFIRWNLCGDSKDQSRNDEVARASRALIKLRLECGLPTVVDDCNIRDKYRKELVEMLPEGARALYVVVNRPLEEKIRDGGWRNDVIMKDGKTLIEYHDQIFHSNLAAIKSGDGFDNVDVKFVNEEE